MLTYPLSGPPIQRNSEKFTLNRKQTPHVSPYSGNQQTVDSYAQWSLAFTFPPMTFVRAEMLAAWLDSLRGSVGTFRYQPYLSGDAALASRSLSGAHYAYGNVLNVGGWTAGADSRLFTGQYLQVGNQLLRISSAPANADGSGICAIEVEPYLRADFANATTVNFVNPQGLFRLTGAEQSGYGLGANRVAEFGPMTAIEVV